MKIAWLFPGQGSQKVGMGRDLCEQSSAARGVFERADAALGFPLSRLCFEGPSDELTLTANLQPALVATSAAVLAALAERYPQMPTPEYAVGHSLGEYSALAAAQVLSLTDAIRVVRERGQAMQAAVPAGEGAMLAVIGGDEGRVSALCDAAREDAVLAPANFNCPGQIVIAGSRHAVTRAAELAKAHGLKAIPLKVSAPFHCSLMRPATVHMERVLRGVTFSAHRFPVIANVDAEPHRDPSETAELLVRQIEGAVRFEQSVQKLVALGVTKALELGPGQVLAGLVKKIAPELEVLSVSDAAGVEQVGPFLGL